jgi:hypothetical protein
MYASSDMLMHRIVDCPQSLVPKWIEGLEKYSVLFRS